MLPEFDSRTRWRTVLPVVFRPVLSLLVLVLAACASPQRVPEAHALAGRIWDVAAQRFIDEADAAARVAAADYALLGETHDNPGHHEIQLRLLERAARDAKPAVAFEQMDREWQTDVDARRGQGASAEAVMTAGHMARSWCWPCYEPLVGFAVSHGLRVIAANYARERSREIVARGLAALEPAQVQGLAIDAAWSAERDAKQRALLVAGHCGQDDPVIDKVVVVQRVRDAVIADAILESPRTVAILGRGHARSDLGVPLYLARRAPDPCASFKSIK